MVEIEFGVAVATAEADQTDLNTDSSNKQY